MSDIIELAYIGLLILLLGRVAARKSVHFEKRSGDWRKC